MTMVWPVVLYHLVEVFGKNELGCFIRICFLDIEDQRDMKEATLRPTFQMKNLPE